MWDSRSNAAKSVTAKRRAVIRFVGALVRRCAIGPIYG
jgi:hypothetical protein